MSIRPSTASLGAVMLVAGLGGLAVTAGLKPAIPMVLALSLGVLGAMMAVAQQPPGTGRHAIGECGTLPHADPPFQGVAEPDARGLEAGLPAARRSRPRMRRTCCWS